MKKFSKESMQNFMLMHAEKLILGGCLAATGVFVWMSMGGGNESKDTPSGLLGKAKSAETYINNPVWEDGAGCQGLKNFRKGEAAAMDKIENAKRVDPDKYPLAIIGSPVQALAKRLDPDIFPAEQLIATRFRAGVLMELPDFKSRLADFFPAPKRLQDGEGGLPSFEGDGDDYGTADFGGGATGRSDGLPANYPALDRSGVFNEVNALTIKGLRPNAIGISPDKITTNVLDVVCVTAVVDFQKQSAAFEKAFSQSIAYNAKRDRPVYQFLQVHRREISGKETPWEDISEDVIYTYPSRCPSSLVKMPLQIYRSAPEVIAPENYDPILSGAIPAFAMLDYQQIATHPALKQQREFPVWVAPKGRKVLPKDGDPLGIFDPDSDPTDDELGGSGGPGDEDGTNALRNGTETESYKEAIVMRKLGGQYRLVRFFDLRATASKTFEYRTRVWVGDPNQLDPSNGFQKNRGMRLAANREGEVKFAGGTGADMDLGMDSMGDMGDDIGMNEKRPEVVQDIQKTMVAPRVRKRLSAATDLETMQERLEQVALAKEPMEPFHVAEYSKTGELEQIKLPISPRKYAYSQYLRFARPSAWSESVRVERKRSSADVFAGPTVQGKPFKMDAGAGEAEFNTVEPAVEVVVSYWDRTLNAKLPSKRIVHVGETLNFNAPAYVTHPISWEVLAGEKTEDRIRGEANELDKFILEFDSGSTIVDLFAGQKMELPNSKNQKIETPTEVLTIDANGDLKVSNQFDSATDYRNEITEKDSSRFFGRPRRSRRERDEPEDDGYGDDF